MSKTEQGQWLSLETCLSIHLSVEEVKINEKQTLLVEFQRQGDEGEEGEGFVEASPLREAGGVYVGLRRAANSSGNCFVLFPMSGRGNDEEEMLVLRRKLPADATPHPGCFDEGGRQGEKKGCMMP